MPKRTETVLALALAALDELKATHVSVLDVRRLTDVTDHMVVATGRSARQVTAIAEHLVQRAKHAGFLPMGVEGLREGEWVLVDLCDVVVHVMQPRVRELYQLERLWKVEGERPEAGHS